MLSSARAKLLLRSALALLGAVLTLGAWLYASPPGSSPDDGYHLGSIWCSRGYMPDRCLEAIGQGDPDIALTPAVLGELTCVGGDGRRSAGCQVGIYDRLDGQYQLTPANLRGVRATLYYWVAHGLVSDDIAASVARIRVANAALALLLVGLTAAVATPAIRRAVLVVWLVASIPLGLFLITSLNSTAWGLAGLGTFWANIATSMTSDDRRRRFAAIGLAIIGVVIALGSRTEAAAHLAVMTLALAIWWVFELRTSQRQRSQRARRITISLTFIATLGALIAAARFSALDYLLKSTSGLPAGWNRLVARGISNPVLTLAAETPQLWSGSLGTWSLGWLDTNMPSIVWLGVVSTFVALGTLGLIGASRGRSAAVLVVLAGFLALPVVSLLSVGLVVLESLQPRHYIPLLYTLLGLALIRSRGQALIALGRGTHLSIVSVITVAHSTALTVNINRYTRGLTEFLYIDTNRDIEWWWGGSAPSPDVVWVLGSLGFGLLAFFVLGLLRASPSDGAVDSMQRPRERA